MYERPPGDESMPCFALASVLPEQLIDEESGAIAAGVPATTTSRRLPGITLGLTADATSARVCLAQSEP
jgi:hypothetical protein